MTGTKLRTWQFRRKGDDDKRTHFVNATSLEEALVNLRTPLLPDGWTDQDLHLEYREADRLLGPPDPGLSDRDEWGEWVSYEGEE